MWTGASVAGVQPARVGSGEGSQLAKPFLSHCSGGLGPHLPHVCEADGFGFGAASSCEPEQRATGVSALTVVAGTLAFSSSPLGRRVAERRKILSPLWPRARAGWPVGSRQAWGWRRRSSPRGRACASAPIWRSGAIPSSSPFPGAQPSRSRERVRHRSGRAPRVVHQWPGPPGSAETAGEPEAQSVFTPGDPGHGQDALGEGSAGGGSPGDSCRHLKQAADSGHP